MARWQRCTTPCNATLCQCSAAVASCGTICTGWRGESSSSFNSPSTVNPAKSPSGHLPLVRQRSSLGLRHLRSSVLGLPGNAAAVFRSACLGCHLPCRLTTARFLSVPFVRPTTWSVEVFISDWFVGKLTVGREAAWIRSLNTRISSRLSSEWAPLSLRIDGSTPWAAAHALLSKSTLAP